MTGPQDRLDLLLRAFRAVGFTVEDLAKQVSLHPNSLTPGRRRILAASSQRAVARAAALFLALDPDQVERWVVAGTGLAAVERRLEKLAEDADKRQCRGCEGLFSADDPEYDRINALCLPCRRAYQRAQKAPAAANYLEMLRAALPRIRKASPEIARAIEQFDPRVTVTYERIAQHAAGGWRAAQVGELLQRLGVGKPRFNATRGESPNENGAAHGSAPTGGKSTATSQRKASFLLLPRWRVYLRSAARRSLSCRSADLPEPHRQSPAGRALSSLHAGEVLL